MYAYRYCGYYRPFEETKDLSLIWDSQFYKKVKTEAVVRGWSSKYLLLEILQFSLENTCFVVLFNNVAVFQTCNFIIKKHCEVFKGTLMQI